MLVSKIYGTNRFLKMFTGKRWSLMG